MQPTQNQIDESAVAYADFAQVFDRLVSEGLDYRAILAGAGAAIAHSITVSAGPTKVAPWFAGQALNARQVIGTN